MDKLSQFGSQKRRNNEEKPFEIGYDIVRQAPVFHILNSEVMYPCYWHDAETGKYRKIIKTSKNKIQMIR